MKTNFKSLATLYTRYIFQLVLLLIVKLIINPFTRAKFDKSKMREISRRGHLIIGNHRGALDPFIICGALPITAILKILPLAFMTHNVFYDSPLRPLLWLSGCYPAKNPHGKHKIFGVEASLSLIQQGYSICIFPEGTRRRSERGPARPGVIRIHSSSPTTPFIFAHIEYYRGLGAWLQRRRRRVAYKIALTPQYEDPEIIMDEIFKL